MSKIKLPHASGNSMSIAAPATNPASDLTLTLPATIGTAGQVLSVDGSGNLVWKYPSVAMVDQWRLSANLDNISANTETVFTANWEQVDGVAFGSVGGAMTQSSGVFTFPQTGIYKVEFVIFANDTESTGAIETKVKMSTDGASGTYHTIALAKNAIPDISTYNYVTTYTSALVDVTSVSDCKIQFATYSAGSFSCNGDSGKNETHASFIRLGDT